MGLFGLGGVKPQKVVEKGQRAPGRIVGIEVEMVSGGEGESDRRVDEYAVEVLTSATVRRGGAAVPAARFRRATRHGRRRASPRRARRHRLAGDERWLELPGLGAAQGTAGRGILDKTLGLKKAAKGVPATVTISDLQIREAMMGLASVLAIGIAVRPDGLDEYDSELKNAKVPFYATHLAEIGRELPGWVNPGRLDKVVIDWAAAAETEPGVGVPPAAILGSIGNVFTGTGTPTSAMSVPADDRPIAESTDGHDAIDGVTFDMWVAVEAGTQRDRVAPAEYDAYAERYGVPPGAYTAAAAGWQARMMKDWRLGAAFGEAVEKAKKNRS